MLDLHVGETPDSASRTHPIASISPELHSSFFDQLGGIPSDFPQLNRLGDYYADCVFAGRELPLLLADIDRITESRPFPSTIQRFLKQLRDGCKFAIENRFQLYAFCD